MLNLRTSLSPNVEHGPSTYNSTLDQVCWEKHCIHECGAILSGLLNGLKACLSPHFLWLLPELSISLSSRNYTETWNVSPGYIDSWIIYIAVWMVVFTLAWYLKWARGDDWSCVVRLTYQTLHTSYRTLSVHLSITLPNNILPALSAVLILKISLMTIPLNGLWQVSLKKHSSFGNIWKTWVQ